MSNVGSLVSTYGLEDSGSETTMIDPFVVKMLNIKGSSKISRTTVNNVDAGLASRMLRLIARIIMWLILNFTWEVKDLTIPLKRTKISN